MGAHLITAFYKARWLAMGPFLASGLCAQTVLTLSSATTTTENASLVLLLDSSSGVMPAAIQWTVRYPPSAVRSIEIVDGPALSSAGKTLTCAGIAGAFTCIAAGLNAELVPNGVIATVNILLEPTETTAIIDTVDGLAVSSNGDPIALAATGGTVSRTCEDPVVPLRRSRDLQQASAGKCRYVFF